MFFKKDLAAEFAKASQVAARSRKTSDGLSKRHSKQLDIVNKKFDALREIIAACSCEDPESLDETRRHLSDAIENYEREEATLNATQAAMLDATIRANADHRNVFKILRQRMEMLLAQS